MSAASDVSIYTTAPLISLVSINPHHAIGRRLPQPPGTLGASSLAKSSLFTVYFSRFSLNHCNCESTQSSASNSINNDLGRLGQTCVVPRIRSHRSNRRLIKVYFIFFIIIAQPVLCCGPLRLRKYNCTVFVFYLFSADCKKGWNAINKHGTVHNRPANTYPHFNQDRRSIFLPAASFGCGPVLQTLP